MVYDTTQLDPPENASHLPIASCLFWVQHAYSDADLAPSGHIGSNWSNHREERMEWRLGGFCG